MAPTKSLKVAVIGPAGFGGSYLCKELIERGHEVHGISRSPEKLGKHSLYTPVVADVNCQSVDELAEVFRGYDVIVNEYGPHSAGHEALQYSKTLQVLHQAVRMKFTHLSQCRSSKSPER